MLRVVVDTNLFVSSLLSSQGAPAQVIDAWRNRKYILVVSEAIITEIRRVLSSPNIQQKYAISEQVIDELVTLLKHETILTPGVTEVSGEIPDDPQDEIFLACAIEGQVNLIVSGDKHLLNLHEYKSVPILTARQFLEALTRE